MAENLLVDFQMTNGTGAETVLKSENKAEATARKTYFICIRFRHSHATGQSAPSGKGCGGDLIQKIRLPVSCPCGSFAAPRVWVLILHRSGPSGNSLF